MTLKTSALDLALPMEDFAPGANNPPRKYGLPAQIAPPA
mgnify:FL=1